MFNKVYVIYSSYEDLESHDDLHSIYNKKEVAELTCAFLNKKSVLNDYGMYKYSVEEVKVE